MRLLEDKLSVLGTVWAYSIYYYHCCVSVGSKFQIPEIEGITGLACIRNKRR